MRTEGEGDPRSEFITGRKNLDLNSRETLEVGEMRDVLTGQFAFMEETWYKLLQSVRSHAVDIGSDHAFVGIARIYR